MEDAASGSGLCIGLAGACQWGWKLRDAKLANGLWLLQGKGEEPLGGCQPPAPSGLDTSASPLLDAHLW